MRKSWERKVNSRFQVTIPAELRKKFALLPGARVVFQPIKGAIYIYPQRWWKKHGSKTRTKPVSEKAEK